jgi:hypothetical protein
MAAINPLSRDQFRLPFFRGETELIPRQARDDKPLMKRIPCRPIKLTHYLLLSRLAGGSKVPLAKSRGRF